MGVKTSRVVMYLEFVAHLYHATQTTPQALRLALKVLNGNHIMVCAPSGHRAKQVAYEFGF